MRVPIGDEAPRGQLNEVHELNRLLQILTIALVSGLWMQTAYGAAPVVESSSISSSNNTISCTLTKDVNTVADDLLIIVVSIDGTGDAITKPSASWNVLRAESQDGGQTTASWWLIAGAAEPGTYTASWTGNENFVGGIVRISGADTANPINVSASSTGTGNPVAPAVTPTLDETRIIRFCGIDDDDQGDNFQADGPDTVLWARRSGGGPNSVSQSLAHKTQPTAGNTAIGTWTIGGGEGWYAATIAIAPKPPVEAPVFYDVDGVDQLSFNNVRQNTFAYKSATTEPEWFQTTNEQFDTGTLTETDTRHDGTEVIDIKADSATTYTAGIFSTAMTVVGDTDGDLTSSGAVSEPVAISSIADTPGERVAAFDFTLSDGGTSDGAPMSITAIVLNTSGTGTFSDVTWQLNGPDASFVTGTIGAGTITFSSLSISVADGASEIYTVHAYFSGAATSTDNETFILSVDGDNDLTVDPLGTLINTSAPVTNGSGSTMEVVHSQLVFTVQPPATAGIDTDFSSGITVTATDANGKVDADFAEAVTLSAVLDADKSAVGTLSSTDTGGVTRTAANGLVSWTNTTFDKIGVVDVKAVSATHTGGFFSTAIAVSAAAPYAFTDAHSLDKDGALSVVAPGVLDNDITDSGALTATLVTDVTSGTLVLSSNGSFTYTPIGGFTGTVWFTYTCNSGAATSNAATVTINVRSAPNVPEGEANPGRGTTWWNNNYSRRHRIHIRNDSTTTDLEHGYTLSLELNHAVMVTAGQSLASGDDVRVVWYSRTTGENVEIDRVAASSWNEGLTKVRFRLQSRLRTGTELRDYFLYYNNPVSGLPPDAVRNVYLMADPFDLDLSQWDTGAAVGDWSDPSLLDANDPAATHYYLEQDHILMPDDYVVEWDALALSDGSVQNFYHTLLVDPADPLRRIVVGGNVSSTQWELVRWITATTQDTPLSTSAEVITTNTFYACETRMLADTVTFQVNGARRFSTLLTGVETGWDPIAGLAHNDSHARFANVRLRMHADIEPNVQLEEPWLPGAYKQRRQITLTNNVGGQALPTGYSVRVDLPHATWVGAGDTQNDGDDVRIVYWDGDTFIELDRTNSTAWNSGTTRLYFKTQAAIPASGTDNNYYVYYDNGGYASGNVADVAAPPNDPGQIYLWHDDFSANTIVSGGDDYVNSVVDSAGVTDDFLAIGTVQARPAVMASSGNFLLLDMGEGEEITDGTGNDFTVYEIDAGTDNVDVYGANLPNGPWTFIGTAGDTASFDLSGTGLAEARYIRIVWSSGTPNIDAVEAINRNADVLATDYVNGKHVEIHGTNTALIRYDSTRQVATFDTGNEYSGGLRIPSINEGNLLLQIDMNTFRTYPGNGTASFMLRWNSLTESFYSHMSAGSYAGGNNLCDTNASPAIGRGDMAERNSCVDNPTGDAFFPSSQIGGGGGGSGDGINVQLSTTTTTGGMTGVDTIRYGIFSDPADATISSHKFWVTTDTDTGTWAENTSYTAAGYAITGQPAFEAAQQWGFCDDLIVRDYVDPEPTAALGTPVDIVDFKVTGVHTYTTPVLQGETNVEILRLDIETVSSDSLTDVVIESLNTTNADINDAGNGVSMFYTGSSSTFSTSTPFGTADQFFAGSPGTVTFTGTQALPTNELVHLFIVYDVDSDGDLGDTLDAQIKSTKVRISGTWYPTTLDINPAGSRQIGSPQTLDSITVSTIDTSDVRPGDTDQQLLRLAFAVSGSGAPLALESVNVTSANDNDTDVSGVSVYYTGTSTTFSTATAFGTVAKPIAGGTVTFTDVLELGDGSSAATFYVFIAYDISESATLGAIVDATIEATDIVVEGVTRSASPADPAGSRTIAVPTGKLANLPPVSSLVDANPALMNFNNFNNTDGGDVDFYVDNLESNDGSYAGGTMTDPLDVFDPQRLSAELLFDLDDEVAGIEGADINSLTFRAELYLTGVSGGQAPAAAPAEWDAIYDAEIQIYDWTAGEWETLGSDFIQNATGNWLNTTEATEWDDNTPANSENPLVRFKGEGFTDDHLDSNGQMKLQVLVEGRLNSATEQCSLIFDYAHIDFNYGANVEQVAYRWADDAEIPAADENAAHNAATNEQLHLRFGIRSRYQPFGSHRLAVQYDTVSTFANADAAPDSFIVTTSSSNLQMWDDTDHFAGDPITGAHLLSVSDADGNYHEDHIPPLHSKAKNLVYEEDFAIVGSVNDTYYLRVVEVDGFGEYIDTLDAYSNVAELIVSTPTIAQAAYRWATNIAAPVWEPIETPQEFVTGTDYILAIRVENTSVTSATNNWQLQFQRTSGVAGPWTSINTLTTPWQAVDGAYAADDAIVGTGNFVTGAGAGAVESGRHSEVGVVRSTTTPDTVSGNGYTEYWYALRPAGSAAANAYRFRVTDAGRTSGFVFVSYPEARQTIREQVSFRIANEDGFAAANENTGVQIATDQFIHVRAGIRSNNADWSGHRLTLQYDTDRGFANANAVPAAYLLTTLSSPAAYWDDSDHDAEDTVSAFLLSGSPTGGRYHESNVLTAVGPAMTADTLYEDDFAITFDSAGTSYLRVVVVDDNGDFVSTLDSYTETIVVTVIDPNLEQNFYNWAPDAAAPIFLGSDVELELETSTDYLVSIQIENTGTVATSGTWRLQYQRTDGTPGSWTTVTTSSTDWQAVDAVYSVDDQSVAVLDFVCNSGNPPGGSSATAVAGVYTETGAVSMAVPADRFTEFWYTVKPTLSAAQHRFRFRITNAGNPGPFTYDAYAIGRETVVEQVSFRWADNQEEPVASENQGYDATVDQELHLRLGVRPNNGDIGASYLALEYDSDVNFRNPTAITKSSANIQMWDDPEHAEGDVVDDLTLVGSQVGDYYEDEVPPGQFKAADVLYECDFTIAVKATGTYYLRVVLVDSGGNNPVPVDIYTEIVAVNVYAPATSLDSYNWGGEGLTGQAGFDTPDSPNEFVPTTTYTLVTRISNTGSVVNVYDWILQYQKTSGTPGAWTDVTTGSANWRSVDSAPADGAAIATADIVDGTTTNAGTGTKAIGRYSESGHHIYSLSNGEQTELRFNIQPQAATAGKAYRFRVSNSGATTGFTYTQYPRAHITTYEQLAWRWADSDNAALEAEDTTYNAALNQLLHVRVGIVSNSGAWNSHKLALQYDTVSTFANADAAPATYLVTTDSANVEMWTDRDRAEGSDVVGVLLTATTEQGIYHQTESQSLTQNKTADDVYEEDFTVQVTTADIDYYLRVVDYNDGTPLALDTYSSPVIHVKATVPSVDQEADDWSENAAAPAWQGDNTTMQFTPGTTYLLAVRIKNEGTSPTTGLNWRLQFQNDPAGSPGPWTDVMINSNEWRAVAGDYGAHNATVLPVNFATAGATGNPVSGKYSEDGIVTGFVLNAQNDYTELWFSVEPLAAAALNRYEFRVTDDGATGSFIYTNTPEAAQRNIVQSAYRWTDDLASAIGNENTKYIAVVGQEMHLRVALGSRHIDWDDHKLAVQYATDIGFTQNVTLITATSASIEHWDGRHETGDAMTGAHLLTGSPEDGLYHEDEAQPATQDKTADLTYEEDFTILPTVADDYFIRVVSVEAGTTALNTYSQIAELTVVDVNNTISAYDWAPDDKALDPLNWQATDNKTFGFQSGNKYIVTVRVEHDLPDSDFDWQLQFQESPNSTPGPWTTVTTTSPSWAATTATTYAKANQESIVAPSEFGTDLIGAKTAVNGVFSNDADGANANLTGTSIYAEYRFCIVPDASTLSRQYRFRLTNSGSTTGFSYQQYLNALNGFYLTTAVSGSGTVDTASQYVLAGSIKTITATPAVDNKFVQWDLDGGRQQNPDGSAIATPLSVTMNADHSVTANFLGAFVDVDLDEVPDWFERVYYNNTAEGPGSNTDSDSLTMLEEYFIDSSPLDASAPQIVYVDDNSIPAGDGSIDSPYKYLVDALDNAAAGSLIRLLDGTYALNDYTVTNDVFIRGNGPRKTFIKGPIAGTGTSDSGQMVSIETGRFVLQDIAARLYKDAAPLISYDLAASPELITLAHVVLKENDTGNKALIAPENSGTGPTLYIYNSVIHGNAGTGYVADLMAARLRFVHNTVVDNTNTAGGIRVNGAGTALVSNSIIRGNVSPQLDDQTGGSLTKEFSNIEGNPSPDDTAQSYIDTGTGYYRLTAGSNGVDGGSGTFGDGVANFVDMGLGRFARPQATVEDQGAYEQDPDDIDGDGLTASGGNDPDEGDPDSDDDGVYDGDEDADSNGLIAGDTNGNRIIDGVETWTETDPSNSDCDNDGVSDGDEIALGQNPYLDDLVPFPGTYKTDFENDGNWPAGAASYNATYPNQVVAGSGSIDIMADGPTGNLKYLRMNGSTPETTAFGYALDANILDFWIDLRINLPRDRLPTDVREAVNFAGANFAIDTQGHLAVYDGSLENWLIDTTVIPDDWVKITIHRSGTGNDIRFDAYAAERLVFADIPTWATAGPGLLYFRWSSVNDQASTIDDLEAYPVNPFHLLAFRQATSTATTIPVDLRVTNQYGYGADKIVNWHAYGVDTNTGTDYELDSDAVTLGIQAATGQLTAYRDPVTTDNVILPAAAVTYLQGNGDTQVRIYLASPTGSSLGRTYIHTTTPL